MKELKVGDRVKFINENYLWFGNEYTVIDINDANAVYVVSDHGTDQIFNIGNLQIVNDREPGLVFDGDDLQVVSKEPTKPKQDSTDTLQRIENFTLKNKNIEISHNNGKMILRDFTPSFEPDEYHCDTIEQLEELMDAWESVSKFKVDND